MKMLDSERIEIRDLVDRYSLGVTLRDQAMIASVFASDGVWKVAAPFNVEVEGADAIAAAICGSLADMDAVCQMVHSVVIDPEADGARVRCVMQEIIRARDGSTGMSMLGIYTDRVVRTDAGLRFAERSFQPHLLDQAVPAGAALA
jgi:hypothetical protein